MESSSIHSAVTGIDGGAAKWRVNLNITSARPMQTTDAAMMTVSGATSQYQRFSVLATVPHVPVEYGVDANACTVNLR